MRTKVLYVFCGELASGAEIVMETLMASNTLYVESHLFISPGKFAEKLLGLQKPYPIVIVPQLSKLNRSTTGKVAFYMKALTNYVSISYKTIKYVYKNNIDVVHANTVVPAAYLIPAVIFSKIFRPKTKWLWTDHDLKYFKVDQFFSNIAYKLYDKTIAVSKAVNAKYGNKPKVELLYNVLDTDIFKPNSGQRQAFRQKWNVNGETLLFAIAGIISPRKGQLELMKAFCEASKTSFQIQLLLAGNFGPDYPDYNTEVRELADKLPNVKYVGHIDNMIEFYNGCDVIINNSSANGSEPFGATIYEAMSCEKIVAAANTGGLPELIDDGQNGFLFEPDNLLSLENQIKNITVNFDHLDEIKKAAREKVKRTFGCKIITDEYNKILKSLKSN